jgi:PhoPQ-activated pathogenicity-related protein
MTPPRSRTFTTFAATLLLSSLQPASGLAQAPAPAAGAAAKTALERYVEAPDPTYKYDVLATLPGNAYTTILVDLTSQTWRAPGEVDRTVWKHWLIVVRPAEVAHRKALLFIGGGNNTSAPPKAADENLVRMATRTKSVVAELRMVPNQPLTFADDKKPRSEDDLIAYTWDKFLRGGDDQWPARLPMTKAAVRALDTIVSVCAKDSLTIDGFVVAGGSKRGWTTWATAVVDRRVVAIMPMVIDLLNIVPSFQHHLAVYGYYAPAVSEYEDIGIMKWETSPRYRELMKIEEPFEYRERLTLPKLIVNATGDQFFLPDSWQFYFDALPGPRYLRYVPNADHSLRGSDVWSTALAFYNAVLNATTLPSFTWRIDKDGTIRVRSKDAPSQVTLWQATNPGARDFRLSSIGARWKGSALTPSGNGEYVAKVAKPRRGFTAYMVELKFPSGLEDAPFTFTTGVKVVPDVEPFRDMVGAAK